MQAKGTLPILALLIMAALTMAPAVAAHPIGPSLGLGVGSGPAYVAQSCNAHATTRQIITCSLSSLEAGGMNMGEANEVPPSNVTDSMGDHFTLVQEVPIPGSTYDLEVFFATASSSGNDSVNLSGVGNFPH